MKKNLNEKPNEKPNENENENENKNNDYLLILLQSMIDYGW